jgi:hypothetical protein
MGKVHPVGAPGRRVSVKGQSPKKWSGPTGEPAPPQLAVIFVVSEDHDNSELYCGLDLK